ncbi:hypothetical protein Esti_001556 [Eimeria stiedai]
MHAEGESSPGALGGCGSLTSEGCMPVADQSEGSVGAAMGERPWLPHAFNEKEGSFFVHPPRHCGSLEALELASDRCNSESSTCAAERHSSPPLTPDSEGFSLLLSFAQSDLGDCCPGEERVGASKNQRMQGPQQGPSPEAPSSSSLVASLGLKVKKPGSAKARGAGGSSTANRGFLDVFYSRQRQQKINEFKTRCETQQSLTAWRRAASNTLNLPRGDSSMSSSSSHSGSSSALSRFLRSSSLSKQQQGGVALSRVSSLGGWLPWIDKSGSSQLQEEETALQQQRTLLRQLQLRAKEERPRGALVAARSQMLQREQQHDAHARRPCGVSLGLEGGPPRLLLTQQRRQQLLQLEQGRDGMRHRVRSLPSRLSVWGAVASAAAAPTAAVSAEDEDAEPSPNLWWKVKGPAARELGGVAAEAAAKAAAVSAAATAAAAQFKDSVAFFKCLRRTASDTHLVARARGPCWAGQRQQTRAGVEELLDQALEVGAATAAAATPEEAASVASCVEGLVGALQLRVLQGQQRVKLHFLIQHSARHHSLNKSLLPGGEEGIVGASLLQTKGAMQQPHRG